MMQIRKAQQDDFKAIASCMLLAMEDIVYEFIGEESPQKARDFMLYFAEREQNPYSYENCWVAEEEGCVIGAVNIYDGARAKELKQSVIAYVEQVHRKQLFMEDETQEGEYYIDTLGVTRDNQGKGIGSQLLQFVIEEYAHKKKQAVGLLVDEDNPMAKKLYVRLGFEKVGDQMLVGKRMQHLQFK